MLARRSSAESRMQIRTSKIHVSAILLLALGGSAWVSPAGAQSPVSIRGRVTTGGSPLQGAYVGAHAAGKTFTQYVLTDRDGNFAFRRLAAGSYGVFTQIPGFRSAHRNGISVQATSTAVADFAVEQETDFLALVEQSSNAELLESFPLQRLPRRVLPGKKPLHAARMADDCSPHG